MTFICVIKAKKRLAKKLLKQRGLKLVRYRPHITEPKLESICEVQGQTLALANWYGEPPHEAPYDEGSLLYYRELIA